TLFRSQAVRTVSNDDGVEKLVDTMQSDFTGLCSLNLVDFDALYGHRRNPHGYGEALEKFDQELPEILSLFHDDDLLILTADHGNNPTHHGTDHTRECVPVRVYHNAIEPGGSMAVGNTFSNSAASMGEAFSVTAPAYGSSFLRQIKGNR